MVRKYQSAFRGRSIDPRLDEDTSIATSRISLDAPGRTAKEVLSSDPRGRKVYVEHHQKGSTTRHRSRPPSIEERESRVTLNIIRDSRNSVRTSSPPKSPSGRSSSLSPRKSSLRDDSTPDRAERRHRTVGSPTSSRSRSSMWSPREGPPMDESKKHTTSRSRSKSALRKSDRARSSSPRKMSKKEPLLASEEDFKRSISGKKKLNQRIRSLKLRILDDDEDKGVPMYKPPVLVDRDSGDEDSSSGCDKYSVTATSGDSVRAEKSKKSKSSSQMKESELQAWKRMAEEAETLATSKEKAPQQDNSEPGWTAPLEKPVRCVESLGDEIESVWSQTSRSEHNLPSNTEFANEIAAPADSGLNEVESQMDQLRSIKEPKKRRDGIVDSPRKASSFVDVIKSHLSSRDVDSVHYINANSEELWSASEDGIIILKQRVAYCCIVVSAIQLGLLIIQLCLCGLASLNINPMIGPFPDAYSEWGGKNVYLMLEGKQYFRIVTPIFLHVGLIHLLINVYCQLETCAFFEREWGSARWITIYLISGMGSVLASSAIEPDSIGVCSSGALMGMFGAKIAQVVTWSIFVLRSSILEDSARFDHLGGVLCSAAMVSLLSFFTYIDWSGQLGGLCTGFLIGVTLFAKPIASRTSRVVWGSMGILGIVAGSSILIRVLSNAEPDEELGDACQYFRSLYPDGYVCECVWE